MNKIKSINLLFIHDEFVILFYIITYIIKSSSNKIIIIIMNKINHFCQNLTIC